jgi:hypothetical protein
LNWSTPESLRAQVQRLWDRGRLLSHLVGEASPFPMRLTFKGPSSGEVSERFDEARAWIARLKEGEKAGASAGYRLAWREVQHRVLGANSLPAEAWVDTLDDAVAMIGRRREAERFRAIVARTNAEQPQLTPWVARHPLRALDLAADWDRLLRITGWLRSRPRPGVYSRQVDLPGVDSKFIEAHRGVLGEFLDLTLPASAIDASAVGLTGFNKRYGLRQKPFLVRFRVLDPSAAVLTTGRDHDLTVTAEDFSVLEVAVSRVFVTENEINYLAFPQVASSLVIFGAGYGFENLAQAHWLESRDLYYWGDIDTHGFAMLDQFRSRFGHAHSFLMDRETMLAHRVLWGQEPRPAIRELTRLDDTERTLYEDLRDGRLGDRVRLEQERIGFGWVQRACSRIGA